jgi:hypothetical protein
VMHKGWYYCDKHSFICRKCHWRRCIVYDVEEGGRLCHYCFDSTY